MLINFPVNYFLLCNFVPLQHPIQNPMGNSRVKTLYGKRKKSRLDKSH